MRRVCPVCHLDIELGLGLYGDGPCSICFFGDNIGCANPDGACLVCCPFKTVVGMTLGLIERDMRPPARTARQVYENTIRHHTFMVLLELHSTLPNRETR